MTITVRLSRKSCLEPVVRHDRLREKVSSGSKLREPQQAGVGSKTRSAGRTPLFFRAERVALSTAANGPFGPALAVDAASPRGATLPASRLALVGPAPVWRQHDHAWLRAERVALSTAANGPFGPALAVDAASPRGATLPASRLALVGPAPVWRQHDHAWLRAERVAMLPAPQVVEEAGHGRLETAAPPHTSRPVAGEPITPKSLGGN
ncbi:hypothetical protein GCM10025786_10590 [Nocardioides caeni]